jgi:hypothetical protein
MFHEISAFCFVAPPELESLINQWGKTDYAVAELDLAPFIDATKERILLLA